MMTLLLNYSFVLAAGKAYIINSSILKVHLLESRDTTLPILSDSKFSAKSSPKFLTKFTAKPSPKPLVKNKNARSKYSVSTVSFIFMLMVVNFVLWYKGKTKEDKFEQQANDPQQMQAILNQFTSLNITPVEYNKLLNELCTNMNDFRLILLELLRRMVISIDENYLHIDLAKLNTLKDHEREFIDILFNVIRFNSKIKQRVFYFLSSLTFSLVKIKKFLA